MSLKLKPRKKRLMVDIYKTSFLCSLEDLDHRNVTTWASFLQNIRQKINAVDLTNDVIRIQSIEVKKNGQDPNAKENTPPISKGKYKRQKLSNCKIPKASGSNQAPSHHEQEVSNDKISNTHERLQKCSDLPQQPSRNSEQPSRSSSPCLKKRFRISSCTEGKTKNESSRAHTTSKKPLWSVTRAAAKCKRIRQISDFVDSTCEAARADGLKCIDDARGEEHMIPLVVEESRVLENFTNESSENQILSKPFEESSSQSGKCIVSMASDHNDHSASLDNDEQESGSPASSVSTINDSSLKHWAATHETEENPHLRYSGIQEIKHMRLPKKPTHCCCFLRESRNKVPNLQARTSSSAFCAYSRMNSTDSSIIQSPLESVSMLAFSDTSKSHTPKPVLRLMGKNLVFSDTEKSLQFSTNNYPAMHETGLSYSSFHMNSERWRQLSVNSQGLVSSASTAPPPFLFLPPHDSAFLHQTFSHFGAFP